MYSQTKRSHSSAVLCAAFCLTVTSGSARAQTPAPPAPPSSAAPSASEKTPPSPATPAPAAKPVPDEPKDNPLYAKGIGFSVRALTKAERKKLRRTHGLYVDHIVKGTPADEGGLKKGDVIMSIEGKTASSAKETIDQVNSSEEGVTLTFVIVRAGKDDKVQIRLPGKSPEERAEEERKEREKKEQEEKERKEREEKERKEREAKEAEEKARKEAEEKAASGEEVKEEPKDRFGMCNFCICSALCPPLWPVWAAMAVFVQNDAVPEDPPDEPTDEDRRVITVAY